MKKKNILTVVLLVVLFAGCSKTENPPDYKIVDGLYEGYFAYQGTSYWHVIELDSFLHNIDPAYYICNPDWLMPGEYNIDYLDNDSLVFERGEGDSKIIYHYRRCPVREMPCPW